LVPSKQDRYIYVDGAVVVVRVQLMADVFYHGAPQIRGQSRKSDAEKCRGTWPKICHFFRTSKTLSSFVRTSW
jgi:hypothetical protein